MKYADHAVIRMIPVQGAWSVEVTHDDGTVWRSPVVAWALTKEYQDPDDGQVDTSMEPVLVDGEGGLETLHWLKEFGGLTGKTRLLLNGADPDETEGGSDR
jgi:hypothetical protein